MNLKYYLRGLGVGIVVTSLILGIGLGSRKETLSNEEIKERARELGMVEESITVAEAAAQKEEEAQEAEVTVAPVPEENAESDAEPIVNAEPEVSSEPAVSTGAAPGVSSEPAVSTGAAPETSEEPNVSAASEPAASTAPEAGATPEAGVKPVADEAEEDSGTAPEKALMSSVRSWNSPVLLMMRQNMMPIYVITDITRSSVPESIRSQWDPPGKKLQSCCAGRKFHLAILYTIC